MSEKVRIEEVSLPLYLIISEIENTLATDEIVGKINENKNLEPQAMAVQKFLDYARKYLVMGFTRRGCRALFRAYAIFQNLK